MTARKNPSAPKQDMLNRRLAVAVCSFKSDEIEQLLKAGADPNYLQSGDEPLLNFTVQFDTPDVVELLIRYGADVNASDKNGVTPLHCALELAELENAAVLLRHGADINHQRVKGQSEPPWVAALSGDRLSLSTVRTVFVLGHSPDFDLVFDHHASKGLTVLTLMQAYSDTAIDKNRDTLTRLRLLLEGYIEERARIAEQQRIAVARREWLDGVQRKPGGKFKL